MQSALLLVNQLCLLLGRGTRTTCKAPRLTYRIAQPTFIEYFNLNPETNPAALDLFSATNGVFQTGGVIGTLTL